MGIRSSLTLAAMLLATTSPALAQRPSSDVSVIPYPPVFFVEYRPATALDMIKHLPGFTLDLGAQGRGYAGNAGNVLIDGERPPSLSDDLSAVLARIPAASIERIDLVRGGAGGIDMHGQPLIANVIRRKQASSKVSGTVDAGVNYDSFNKDAGSIGLQVQRSQNERTLDASLKLYWYTYGSESDALRLSPTNTILQQGHSLGGGGGTLPAATAAFETPWAGGKLRINGQLGLNGSYYNKTNQLIIPGGAEEIAGYDRTWNGELGLRYSHPLPHGFSAELVGLQQLSGGPSTSIYNTPTFTSSTLGHGNWSQSVVSGTLTFPKHGAWSTEAGTELAYNRHADQTAFSFNASPFALAGDSTVVEEQRIETFLTTTWRPTDRFSIQAGSRYERSTITASGTAGGGEQSLTYLKPRLNITWAPDKQTQWSLKVERVVDQLAFSAFAASASFSTGILSIGNPDLRPTNAWVFEGRYEKRFWSKGTVSLTAVHKALDDVTSSVLVTVPDPLGGPPAVYDIGRNIGTGRIDELTLAATLPLDRLGLKGGEFSGRYLWRQSSLHDPVTFVDRAFNLAPSSWNFGLSQQVPHSPYSWGLTGAGNGASTFRTPRATYYSNPGSQIGVWLGYEPRPGLKWTVGVDGVTAVDGQSVYTLYDGPRNVAPKLYTETARYQGAWLGHVALRRTL
jgi:hypothetical protein